MRTLVSLLLVVALVVGVVWLMQHRDLGRVERAAKKAVDSAAHDTKQALKNIDIKLDPHELGEELKQTGRVVRRKAVVVAHKVAEATEDARTTAAIKARYALDPDLSALEISVDTTDGRVTLAGRVDSPELLARAIGIALARDDVREVVSTIQVRPPVTKKVTLVR
jgi:hypothetical protein